MLCYIQFTIINTTNMGLTKLDLEQTLDRHLKATKEYFAKYIDEKTKDFITRKEFDRGLEAIKEQMKEFVTKDVLRVQLQILRQDIRQDMAFALTGLASRMRITIDNPILVSDGPRTDQSKQSPRRPSKSSHRKAPNSDR